MTSCCSPTSWRSRARSRQRGPGSPSAPRSRDSSVRPNHATSRRRRVPVGRAAAATYRCRLGGHDAAAGGDRGARARARGGRRRVRAASAGWPGRDRPPSERPRSRTCSPAPPRTSRPSCAGWYPGELRQGALDGVMLDALAEASDLPGARDPAGGHAPGATGPVAAAALNGGAEAVAAFGLRVGQPVQPMLASTAPDITEAITKLGPGEPRVRRQARRHPHPGARATVTRSGSSPAASTTSPTGSPRSSTLSLRCPRGALSSTARRSRSTPDGRPRPFQETASRTATRADARRCGAGP